jgi:abhydrolase domain-containing protein 6
MTLRTTSAHESSESSWMAELGIRIEIATSGLAKRELALAEHRIVYLDTRSAPTQSDDPPIVMLHGFGGDKLNWVRYARHLTSHYRVIIPDLPGFGESEWHSHLIYSMRNQAIWLGAFLDALGIPKAHIAGNSMGGHIATHFAIRAPERVETLLLFAPAGTEGAGPPWDETKIEPGRHPLKIYSIKDFDQLMQLVFVKQPTLIGPVRRYFAMQAVARQPYNQKIFEDIAVCEAGNELVEPMLPSLRMPTLVLWGDTDRLLDCGQAHVYETMMPDARAIVLPRCGHMPMAEQPHYTACASLDFLESVRRDPWLRAAKPSKLLRLTPIDSGPENAEG